MLGSWPQRLKNNELRKSAIMFRICSFISFSELKNQKKLLRTNVACCCKAAKSVSSLWAPSPQNRNTRGVSECDISKHFLGGLLIAIEKWLQADHLLILWRDMLVMLVQAQDARHAPGTSNPISSATAPKRLGGCTCGPAVQVGDKAMLPASAMLRGSWRS